MGLTEFGLEDSVGLGMYGFGLMPQLGFKAQVPCLGFNSYFGVYIGCRICIQA